MRQGTVKRGGVSMIERMVQAGIAASVWVILAASAAWGQSATSDSYTNPERQRIDQLGVSIDEALYVRNDTLLSIGNPAADGLAWTFHGHNTVAAADFRGYISFDDSISPNMTFVNTGESSFAFINGAGSTYINAYGKSGTLTVQSLAGGNYTYTSEDGTVFTYTADVLATILKPNGTKITLNGFESCTDSDLLCDYIYTSAVTNTGYALMFGTGTIQVVNMSAHSCDAQALSCDAYDNTLTMVADTDPDMAGRGGKWVYTDTLGNAWHYRVNFSYVYRGKPDPNEIDANVQRGPPTIWAFKDPNGYLVTMNFDDTNPGGGLISLTDPRGTFAYNAYAGFGADVHDPSSASIYASGQTVSGTNVQFWTVDGLGRQNAFGVDLYSTATIPGNGFTIGDYSRVTSITHPEGDSLAYSYDSRGNIVSTVRNPKSGSGLSATTVYQAGYDATCSNLKTCNQPNWTKDALGNETDYTYDATHGGVLTVTAPPDQNGLRKRIYNTYQAYDTGNGYIYRLVQSDTCALNSGQLSLSGCPTGPGTETTTSTSKTTYVGKTFLPYQVTQTDGNNSLTATTTYSYDNVGNVVCVDGPRTDVDDRSYTTYDADRRKVFEIGVDPDGGGPLKRVIVHHVYSGTREIRTETGTGNNTDGSDFTVTSFTRMTYDAVGRVIKTEAVLP